jgi:hypothetical protein
MSVGLLRPSSIVLCEGYESATLSLADSILDLHP